MRPRADDFARDEGINPEDVLLGEPIVGVESVRYDEHRGTIWCAVLHVAQIHGCGVEGLRLDHVGLRSAGIGDVPAWCLSGIGESAVAGAW